MTTEQMGPDGWEPTAPKPPVVDKVEPKTGRPPSPRNRDRTSTGVRFEKGIHDRLKAAAEERNVAVNFLVNRAVEEFLDRLIPVDEMQWTRPPEQPTKTVYLDGMPAFDVVEDRRPHSRACGIHPHPHGTRCAADCPTCHGRTPHAVTDCDPDRCCPYCDRHTTPHKGCVLR